jgi:AcrR family transcriptional regulator
MKRQSIAADAETNDAEIAPSSRRSRTSSKGGRPSRRQEIFDNAIVLMHEKGFVGTSVQDLADRLDFSKANFYYHIKSKEEMLYRISYETLTLKFERIQKILDTDRSHAERMRAIIDCFVNLVIDHTAVISVYFEEKRHLSPAHFKKVTAVERQILDSLTSFYQEGVENGSFKDFDPAVAVLGILGMCFWITKWYRPNGRLTTETISSQLQEMVTSGYLHPSAR